MAYTKEKINTKKLEALSIHDIELERAVLSGLLFYPEIQSYIWKIDEDDFYRDKHKEIFLAMKETLEDKKELNPNIMPTSLKKSELYNIVMAKETFQYEFEGHFKELKDISAKRKMQKLAYEVTVRTQEDHKSGDIKSWLSRELDSVKTNLGNKSVDNESVDKEFEEKLLKGEGYEGVESGYVDLDNIVGGFCPGTFTIIAGTPTVGKSTFALNIVNHICSKLHKKVLFVSLEMSYLHLQAKIISEMTGLNSRKITNPRLHLTDYEKELINDARTKLSDYKLFRMGNSETNSFDIENEIKNLGGIDIVFIDYLQLMSPNNYSASRYDRMSQVSRDLKRLSNRMNIPVVCIASINRSLVGRNSKRPQLTDLRDSGNIEYDIDTALFLHREATLRDYDPMEDECTPEEFMQDTELIIAKNRYGESGMIVKLLFDAKCSRFVNAVREKEKQIEEVDQETGAFDI